jgi:cytochrome P450
MSDPSRPKSVDEVDFFHPATQENWYPTYDLLREEAPVWEMAGRNTYVLTRFDDIQYVLRRTDVFLRGASPRTPGSGNSPIMREIYEHNGWPRNTVLGSNPPDHRKYRDIVDPFFSVLGAAKRRDLIQGFIDGLLDEIAPMGECEFVRDFATPLPVRVITAIMGFRQEDIPSLKVWSEAWVLPFRGGLTEDEERYAGEKGVEFQRHIFETMQEKKADPDDSVISYLVNEARFDGQRALTDAEIINMVDHLYIGGNETTTFALTSEMWLMLSQPHVYAALLADRSHIKNFVEESLRLESPTMGMVRNAALDTEINGCPIPKGSNVHIRYAAGNRDERIFPNPEVLDLERGNCTRQMAFSVGETHCTGAGLSRLEQNMAFASILEQLPKLRLVDGRNDFAHHPNVTLRAMKHLWIQWDPPT